MEMDQIQNKVKDILGALGIRYDSFEVVTDHELGMTIFSIKSDDGKLFYPKNGEALRALNHLLHRIVGQEEANFLLDINLLQQKRIAELKGKARVVADRVRSYETSLAMDPMSAYERLLIHTFLADESGVVTESEGEGFNRHVVVKYAN